MLAGFGRRSIPVRRMNMRMIKDVLRLEFDGGFSHDLVAASLGISEGVVVRWAGRRRRAGMGERLRHGRSRLERRLLGKISQAKSQQPRRGSHSSQE
jgi:hypothetical protein